jgi:hypothetical protein
MNKKTSNLQKRILTTIYSHGECKELVSVLELNPKKVSVEYQLEKQRLVDERDGVFVREDRDIEGLLTKNYEVRAYKLKRSKLACILFDWQKFNLYPASSKEIHFKVKPEDYYTREVAFTNSLKSLKAKGYIELLDYYENKLSLFGKKQAKTIWLTTEGIKKVESILTIKLN